MRTSLVLAAAAVGALAVTGSGRTAPPRATTVPPTVELIGLGNSAGSGDPPGQQNKTFAISGELVGLYPGSAQPLVLRLDNPQAFAIRVTSLTVDVSDGSPACPAWHLVVDSLTAPVDVPRGGSATTTLTARLAAAAPDACQAITYPLTYRGRAEKA
jgi:hypothetical protein